MRYTTEDKKAIAKYQKQEVYEEDDWGGNRRLIGYRCKKCRIVLPLKLLEVDHIIPRASAQKGIDRPSNLQLLCGSCNKKKGKKMPAKAVAKTLAKKKKAARKTVKKRVKTTASKNTTKKKKK